jgi:DNA-binding GntR family transcriptional regulator
MQEPIVSQASRLRQEIEDAIIAGRFAPGVRLDETSLAERFGVSRTPIREALQQLGAAGLIEVRPHRGAVVSAPNPHRLLEMFEAMAELEAACGRLAARRLTSEDEAALQSAHAACVEAADRGDPERYYDENQAFHRAIYQATRNGFLAEQALSLHRRLSAYRRTQLRARNRVAQSLKEHDGILRAIVTGDEDCAARLLHEHVLLQGQRFTDLMLSLAVV